MANPVTVEGFHAECVQFYEHSPRITYSRTGGSTYKETDCRGVVLGAVRNAGYKDFRFAGTNDFWSNFCRWKGMPAEAKQMGFWKPGLLMFNVDDGTGKTTHMGVLTARRKTLYPDIEKRDTGDIINSSESKNGMILSDFEKSGGWWNGCALAIDKVIDYGSWFGSGSALPEYDGETAAAPPQGGQPALRPGQAMVRTNDGNGLNLRKGPEVRKDNGIKTMPEGTVVDVVDFRGEWALVKYVARDGTPHKGWCKAGYLLIG